METEDRLTLHLLPHDIFSLYALSCSSTPLTFLDLFLKAFLTHLGA